MWITNCERGEFDFSMGSHHGFMLLVQIILFFFLFIAIYFLITFMISPQRRNRLYRGTHAHYQRRSTKWLLTLLFIPSPNSRSMREKQQLLIGCGLTWRSEVYVATRRMLTLSLLAIIWGTIYIDQYSGPYEFHLRVVQILLCALISFMWLDKPFLEAFMRYRRQKIISDIYIISRQLLYYTGSRMNLHTKLVRCIPYTHMIRNELYMLTNEWYHNASYAISRFKQRIGTEEGYNFAETLNSLRQHESEEYYELLRQRVQDYKEKLELTKEGRKESVSYILFTLAGIPILFTFRVFIYPWVAEGQKLFDSLG
jgi:hypothetical protein